MCINLFIYPSTPLPTNIYPIFLPTHLANLKLTLQRGHLGKLRDEGAEVGLGGQLVLCP